MKHWEKGKKDRLQEDRNLFQDQQKKRKLKPVEKTKYRMKEYLAVEEDDEVSEER
ncbi:MAG: hypothetical protein IPL65_16715 [Lewinellaceae bacterium]|nr:hypothetical protein [Lewinellaceae bacterium]